MIWEQEPYVTCGSLTMTTEWRQRSAWWSSRWRRWPSARDRRRGRRAVSLDEASEQWTNGSGDLLSRSQMHINERDEVALAAQQQKRWNLDVLVFSWLLVFVAISVAATRIYREDMPTVTASRNWLGLSLSKRIRHGLVAKINGKRRPRACEALGRILVDYSCTRRAPAPIASPCHTPRHAPPRPDEASERACVFSFLLSSTHLQMYREQPTL
jgi:hypothetical protein